MDFSTIDLRSPGRVPPPGWKRTGYGYFQMDKVQSQVKIDRDIRTHKTVSGPLLKGEGFIEQQFFLNIMRNLEGHVNIMELGAGRGDWCLALAGIVNFNLIDHNISSYKCYAVEGEPTHFEWTKTHFEEQGINAVAIHGAISKENGECKFYAKEDPSDHYGQCIHDDGDIIVPTFSLDYLVDKYQIDKIDILHVDIQGAEYDMLLGAVQTLKQKKIKYMMIGMHRPEFNEKIKEFLKPYGYEVQFSALCHSGFNETPFGNANLSVDGLLVLECK